MSVKARNCARKYAEMRNSLKFENLPVVDDELLPEKISQEEIAALDEFYFAIFDVEYFEMDAARLVYQLGGENKLKNAHCKVNVDEFSFIAL